MDNKEIASEKGIKVLIGVFAFAFLFFVYYLASLMSVAPAFIGTKIAHAPVEEPVAMLNLIEF